MYTTAYNFVEKDWGNSEESDLRTRKLQDGDETTTDVESKLDHPDQSDRGEIIKDTDTESPEDIAIQVIQTLPYVLTSTPTLSIYSCIGICMMIQTNFQHPRNSTIFYE